MDIKRLSHFIALAEEGRFVTAAARVHLSQAAFSRSIQALESRLGVQLLERTPQGVNLTAAGKLVLQRARSLVFDSDCLARDLALHQRGDFGEVVIGAAPAPAATLLPGLLARLRQEQPQLVVRLRFGNLPHLAEQLGGQALDFCMGDPRLIAHGEHLSMQRLCKVYASLCCRRDHPLAGTPELSPEALRRFGVGAVSMTPALLLSVARGLGFGSLREFPLTLECDDVSMLLRVVASTDLIGIVPEAPFDLGVERLQRLPWARSRAQYADVHALWLTGRTLTPAARRAIELAREVGFSPPHAAARSR